MADRDRRPPLGDDAGLEAALRDVGRHLAYPPTPDLVPAVRARVGARATPITDRAWPAVPLWRVAAAVALVALLMVGLLALFPAARSAIAERLGLAGVAIRFVETAPTAEPSPVGDRLLLGRRVSLAAAREAVPFPLRVPQVGEFVEPDEVYLSRSGEPVVSFVYRPRADLPESAVPGVGALLTQFRGELEQDLIEKGLGFQKGVGGGTTLEFVVVNGQPGFWIEGAPHGFLYRDPRGEVREAEYRLAGNVLLWEDGDVTLRFESALPKDEALAVASATRIDGVG